MSYILEALKKSQAERQLGSAPTIHALPIDARAAHAGARRPRTMRIAIAFAALGVGAVSLLTWRQQSSAPVAPATAPIAAPVAVPPAPIAAPAAPVLAAPPATPPVAAGPAPQPAIAKPAPSRATPHSAPPAVAVAGKPAPAPVAEDLPPTLRELPDAVQREVPQVAIGGYIYSKNPEDRLLLIDKVLRHEGEEVAPGLTLEKLLPKSAVMRYKTYRYRVPY